MKVLDMGGKMAGLLHTDKTIADVSVHFNKLSLVVRFSEATLMAVALIQKDEAKYVGAFVELYKNWAEELQSVFDRLAETNLQAPASESNPDDKVEK
jgi:predicted proteasome-type protease